MTAQTQAGGRQPGRGGSPDEPADHAVAVTRSDKTTFDQLCNKHGWTQGRMFREILDAFTKNPEVERLLSDIGHTTPETT